MAVTVMVASFVVMLLLTAPVAFAIGVAASIGLFIADAAPLLIIPQRFFAGADSFVLLAIPLFILAGALMETGGISLRLVELARLLVGHIRGGLGMAVVVAEMFFSGISGSTVADVSAIGALMVPSLIRIGFKPDRAVAIIAASSAMGILVPPCLIMVVIAQIAGISVGALFLAGFVPAAVLAGALMALIYVQDRREGIGGTARASWTEIGRAFRHAIIPLMMPVIVFGAILGGIADPTEAAVLAVAYAFVVGVFVYKEIRWSQLPKIFIDSAVISGIVIFMVGAASSFSWILAYEHVPEQLAQLMLMVSSSPIVFYILSITIFTFLGRARRAACHHHLPADLPADRGQVRRRPAALFNRRRRSHRARTLPAADRYRTLYRLLVRQSQCGQDLPRDAALYGRARCRHPGSDAIPLAHTCRSTPGLWLILQRRYPENE